MKKQLLLFILAVLAVTVFCFWLFLYPFIPIVREMSQLFLWTGDYFVERIMIPEGGELHANGSYADFDVDEWHQLLQANKGGQLTFTVCAEKDGQWTQYRDFQVFVSNEEMDAWGITYRRIPPSYEIFSKMGLYQRCLSNFEETALIENFKHQGNASTVILPTEAIPISMSGMCEDYTVPLSLA